MEREYKQILIVSSGHLSATLDAAQRLARLLPCLCTVADTRTSPSVAFERYDAVVFGTNVRMMMFHPRFFKYVMRWKKSRSSAPVYVYISGIDKAHAQLYCQGAVRLISPRAHAVFVNGYLDVSRAGGVSGMMTREYVKRLRARGNPLPQLDDIAIARLAERICADLHLPAPLSDGTSQDGKR